jgi:hypothetical protein
MTLVYSLHANPLRGRDEVIPRAHTHTHTHTHIYIYINYIFFIMLCFLICVLLVRFCPITPFSFA